MSSAYHLFAMRGLCRGEACGLKWDDLDLDEGIAYLSRQLQQGADGQLRNPAFSGRFTQVAEVRD
jgi:integrase